jgi:hypothetical protein
MTFLIPGPCRFQLLLPRGDPGAQGDGEEYFSIVQDETADVLRPGDRKRGLGIQLHRGSVRQCDDPLFSGGCPIVDAHGPDYRCPNTTGRNQDKRSRDRSHLASSLPPRSVSRNYPAWCGRLNRGILIELPDSLLVEQVQPSPECLNLPICNDMGQSLR